jgi:hypothetical protein
MVLKEVGFVPPSMKKQLAYGPQFRINYYLFRVNIFWNMCNAYLIDVNDL